MCVNLCTSLASKASLPSHTMHMMFLYIIFLNMENNPLYEMRIKSNERHSHKTETAAGAGVYENVDNVNL